MRRPPEKYRKWLLQELPALETEGVITADERTRLAAHYEQIEPRSSPWITITLSSLGALLIGGGIILLFAHNWEHLSRTARAVLSVTPLGLATLVSAWSLGKHSKAREAAGIFHALAVGAGIALIGQTYHLPSNTPAFLLSWALLTVPLVFILSSNGALLIYGGLITAWSGAAQYTHGHALGFWLLLVPMAIRVGLMFKQDRTAPGTLVALWGFVFTVLGSTAIVMERTMPGLWIIVYASLLSGFGLLGLKLLPHQQGARNPLATSGVLGVSILTYLFSWHDLWKDIGWSHRRDLWNYPSWGVWADIILTLVLVVAWALLAVRAFKPKFGPALILSIFPAMAVMGFALAELFTHGAFFSAVFFNAFMLALGTAYLIDGCKHARLSRVNYGMLLLSGLILTRFFDGDFGFLARGIAFILIGAGFLAVNLFISRRKRRRP